MPAGAWCSQRAAASKHYARGHCGALVGRKAAEKRCYAQIGARTDNLRHPTPAGHSDRTAKQRIYRIKHMCMFQDERDGRWALMADLAMRSWSRAARACFSVASFRRSSCSSWSRSRFSARRRMLSLLMGLRHRRDSSQYTPKNVYFLNMPCGVTKRLDRWATGVLLPMSP